MIIGQEDAGQDEERIGRIGQEAGQIGQDEQLCWVYCVDVLEVNVAMLKDIVHVLATQRPAVLSRTDSVQSGGRWNVLQSLEEHGVNIS